MKRPNATQGRRKTRLPCKSGCVPNHNRTHFSLLKYSRVYNVSLIHFSFSESAYHNDIILEVCDHYGLQYQNPTLFFLQSNSNDHACIVRDCNTYSTCSLGLLFYNHKRLLFTSKNKKGRCLKKFSDIAQII